MTEYLVSVAVSGRPFQGSSTTIAKSIRVTASDAVEAGEIVLDRLVSGTTWMFSSARASVTRADSHETEATIVVQTAKPFGLPRYPTRDAWIATPKDASGHAHTSIDAHSLTS